MAFSSPENFKKAQARNLDGHRKLAARDLLVSGRKSGGSVPIAAKTIFVPEKLLADFLLMLAASFAFWFD